MTRLQKKCLLASACLHSLLLCVVLFGSAFFVAKSKPPVNLPAVRVVPSRLVDAALSGGGGNPNAKPSDGRQKGNTLTPPRPEPAPQEARKPEPKAAEPQRSPKEPAQDPTATAKTSKPPLELKPVVRQPGSREKAKADADAKKAAAARNQAAKELTRAMNALKEGFNSGTTVDVFGPGGEAYANYGQWVREVYDNNWLVTRDVADDNSTALVKVTIARTGHVIAAEMVRRSGNAALDRSVQRTLDKVKFVAPFPEGSRDEQRIFHIEFNLKAKRMIG